MHELKKRAAAADATATAEERNAKSATFRSSLSPEKIREVLSRRQRMWDQRLLAAKQTKTPVVPQVRYGAKRCLNWYLS